MACIVVFPLNWLDRINLFQENDAPFFGALDFYVIKHLKLSKFYLPIKACGYYSDTSFIGFRFVNFTECKLNILSYLLGFLLINLLLVRHNNSLYYA